MNKKDLSIIMCGKLREHALSYLEYYKSIASVVISCWDTDDLEILKRYNLDGVRVIVNNSSVPEHSGPSSCYFQCKTAYEASRVVRTKYTIKTRLDQCMSDFGNLIRMMEENPDKIIAGSPHFSKGILYHAGDHFYACKTKTMRIGLYFLKRALEAKLPEGTLFNCNSHHRITQIEQFITRALLYANGERDFATDKVKEVMQRNYEVCMANTLGDYHYYETMMGHRFYPNGSFHPGLAAQDLHNIRDL